MAKKVKEEEKVMTPSEQLEVILQANKADHYNFEKTITYKVSSGSLLFDIEINGGIEPGSHRFLGTREAGKTSSALAFARNFQLTVPNSCVVYIKAEGRFNDNIKARSGLNFDKDRFLLIESNIYEFVIDLIRTLVHENPNDTRYMFIVDSLDGLITKAENEKTSEESIQPGTAGRMTSQMFKKISLSLSKRGHIGIFISQERAHIDIDKYGPKAQKQGNSAGGNAIQHFVDFAFEFQTANKSDYFYEDQEAQKGRVLGKMCKVRFHKTTNEKTNTIIQYPIRWGRTNGESIWKEKEVADVLIQFEIAKKSGKGIVLDMASDFVKDWKAKYPEVFKEDFTYIKTFYSYLENNQEMSLYLWNKLREAFISSV